jgi:RHS repeat-associated protein
MPTTNYIWDEDNLLAEADGSNTMQTVYTNEPQQYGNLVSTRLPVAGTPATVYHHFDAIGSTRQLTNAAGNVINTIIYDAWGNVVTRSGTTALPRLWVGEATYYFDSETGLLWVCVRPFGPVSGRWTSVDPLSLDANFYRYARNSPSMMTDPSGLACGSPAPMATISYIPGRGTFERIAFDTSGVMTAGTRPSNGLWSFLSMDFQQNLAFKQGSCCCCWLIGFVQIVRITADYTGFLSPWGRQPKNKWIVDDGICGIPYNSQTIDPCTQLPTTPPQPFSALPFSDNPAIPFPYFGHIKHFKQEFEACVLCLSAGTAMNIRFGMAIHYGVLSVMVASRGATNSPIKASLTRFRSRDTSTICNGWASSRAQHNLVAG